MNANDSKNLFSTSCPICAEDCPEGRAYCSVACEDRAVILGVTGNAPVTRDTAAAMGLSVKEKLEGQKERNELVLLSFPEGEAVEARKWLKERFQTLKGYADTMLGVKRSKAFLARLKRRLKDPEAFHVYVRDILGVPREKIDQVTSQRPGRAWYQEHKLSGELLCHDVKDGANPDESDARWKQNEDGTWESTGYKIPYLRKLVQVVEKDPELGDQITWERRVVVVKTWKGEMKVLNINISAGDKPGLKYHNLVLRANSEGTSMKDQVISKGLIRAYRKAMYDRDPSINTCQNGKICVYYKKFRVEGKPFCVFSPIPFDDLTDEAKEKLAKGKEVRELWDSLSDIIQEV